MTGYFNAASLPDPIESTDEIKRAIEEHNPKKLLHLRPEEVGQLARQKAQYVEQAAKAVRAASAQLGKRFDHKSPFIVSVFPVDCRCLCRQPYRQGQCYRNYKS